MSEPAPTDPGSAVAGRRSGRQPVSSRAEIEHAAFRLFDERGFDNTTIDDIAGAAGIAWRLSSPSANLLRLLDKAFRELADGFAAATGTGSPPVSVPAG